MPGMAAAYSSGVTPTLAAMIATASAWVLGSRTKSAIRYQTLTTFAQSALRWARLVRVDARRVS